MDQFKRSFIRSGVVLVRSPARVWGSNTQGWVKLFTGADVLNPDRQNSRFHLHKCKAVKKKPCSVFKSHNSDRAGKAVLKAGLSGSGGDVRWCGRRNWRRDLLRGCTSCVWWERGTVWQQVMSIFTGQLGSWEWHQGSLKSQSKTWVNGFNPQVIFPNTSNMKCLLIF